MASYPMIIALDHDDTITRDPLMWGDVVKQFIDHGHTVYIVTARSSDLPIEYDLGLKVFYTSWTSKREYMTSQGINIDVWIDDSPEMIVKGAYFESPGEVYFEPPMLLLKKCQDDE